MNEGFAIPLVLRTQRLVLRPIAIGDANDIFAYCSDKAVTRYVPWPTHRTIDDTLEFVRRRLKAYGAGPVLDWAIAQSEDAPVIGWIGIDAVSEQHLSGELGYVLARPFWKRGLMTEAVRIVLDTAFRYTPLNRVEARCNPANRASSRVMEKSGMVFEGTLREVNFCKEAFEDLQIWSFLRRDWLAARGR